jgi:hypothetical protein
MKIKAMEELMLICDMETDDSKVGWRKRREAMESWISKYVEVIETRQSVLNPQYFDSQFMDFIKESIAKKLAEDLTTPIKYDINNREIKAKMLVININKGLKDA